MRGRRIGRRRGTRRKRRGRRRRRRRRRRSRRRRRRGRRRRGRRRRRRRIRRRRGRRKGRRRGRRRRRRRRRRGGRSCLRGLPYQIQGIAAREICRLQGHPFRFLQNQRSCSPVAPEGSLEFSYLMFLIATTPYVPILCEDGALP